MLMITMKQAKVLYQLPCSYIIHDNITMVTTSIAGVVHHVTVSIIVTTATTIASATDLWWPCECVAAIVMSQMRLPC
jgi:hypothetical protein